jgi:transcriptional regulator with XRE-family HTH domain
MKSETRIRFGEKLRTVRERKGITLKQVAAKINASESLISQIERNRVSPSVDTLIAIADALDIDLDYLFKDFKKNKKATIVKKENRFTFYIKQVIYRQLSVIQDPMDEYSIEALLLEIPPGASTENRDYGHPGKELGIILEGEALFTYGNEVYDLAEGDSINFASDIPHTLTNSGKEKLVALWVVTPPRLFGKTSFTGE